MASLRPTDVLVACSLDVRITVVELARLTTEETEQFCQAITTLATLSARLKERNRDR